MSNTELNRKTNSEEMAREFFKDLEMRFNISVHEWCKAKNMTYNTIMRFLRGEGIKRDRLFNKVMRQVTYWKEYNKKK